MFLLLTAGLALAPADWITRTDYPDSPLPLRAARKQEPSKLHEGVAASGEKPDRPPKDVFLYVRYPSPAGRMRAYLTPDTGDGKKRPAVLWAKGGFGGIGGSLFSTEPDPANDQTALAFREAGFVVMCPSWRGENDNPGKQELFYGEVDDLLAARDFLADMPHVDPDRIYLAGHSTGGTLVLLAACATDKFRACFSFGGCPDLYPLVARGTAYGLPVPFDHRDERESYFRSSTYFAAHIRRPTFYFEGCKEGFDNSFYCQSADAMMAKAKKAKAPFEAFALPWGDHFTILHETTRRVDRKIAADTGKECNISFSRDELRAR